MIDTLLALVVQDKISFRHPPAEVSEVLAAYAEQTGQKISASGNLKRDFIGVNVTNVAEEDFLTRLAAALDAEWERSEAGLVLARPNRMEREEWQRELAFRREAVQKQHDEAQARIAKMEAWNTQTILNYVERQKVLNEEIQAGNFNYEKWQEVNGFSPLSRSVPNLIEAIGAETLAAIAPGERVVLSSRPNNLQKRMPSRLIEEVGSIKQMMKQMLEYQAEEIYFNAGNAGIATADLSTARIALKTPMGMSAEATLYAQPESRIVSGDTIARPMVMTDGGTNLLTVMFLPNSFGETEAIENDREVLFKPATVAIANSIAAQQSQLQSSLPPEVTDLFLEKDFEPYQYGLAEYMDAMAADGTDIIFRPSIFMWAMSIAMWSRPANNGQVVAPKVGEMTQILRPYTEVTDEQSWKLIRSRTPVSDRSAEIERNDLRQAIKLMLDPSPGLLSQAYIIKQANNRNSINLLAYFSMLCTPNYDRYLGFGVDKMWRSMRVLGSLSNPQVDALRSGEKIPIQSLSPSLQNLCKDALLADLLDELPGSEQPSQREPTDVLVRGIPAGSYLSWEENTREGLMTYMKMADGQFAKRTFMDLNSSASNYAYSEVQPNQWNQAKWYRPATQIMGTFRIVVPGGCTSSQLTEVSIADGEPVSYTELPEPMKTRFVEALERMRKAYRDYPPTGGASTGSARP